MTNPLSTPAASNFGLLLARATLGVYFAAIGYSNVMKGVSAFARENLKPMSAWIDVRYAEVFLTMYPVLQVATGVMLAIGVFTRLSAGLLAISLSIFIVCVQGFNPPAGMPFEPSVIFVAVAIAIVTNGGGNLTLPELLGKKSGSSAPKAPAPAPAK
jgi:uncharacterized membrane protein YphA (DoxX/SURF4 family)